MGKKLWNKYVNIATWLDGFVDSLRKEYRKAPDELKPLIREVLKNIDRAKFWLAVLLDKAERIPDEEV